MRKTTKQTSKTYCVSEGDAFSVDQLIRKEVKIESTGLKEGVHLIWSVQRRPLCYCDNWTEILRKRRNKPTMH